MKINYAIKGMLLSSIFLSLMMGSCVNLKKVTYFNDIPDTIKQNGITIDVSKYDAPLIEQNELLQVSIQTLDQDNNLLGGSGMSSATGAVSSSGSSPLAALNSSEPPTVLVDHDGYIELPLVGKIKVEGLTTSQARDLIAEKAITYYNNPIVNVRIANYYINVLGQVMHPGQYIIANEKVSVMDAISMAGDMTIFGKRNDVLLLRNEGDGKKLAVRFNLNSSTVFNSPYFYLKSGDIIVVNPNKVVVTNTDQFRNQRISLTISALSFIIILFTYLKK